MPRQIQVGGVPRITHEEQPVRQCAAASVTYFNHAKGLVSCEDGYEPVERAFSRTSAATADSIDVAATVRNRREPGNKCGSRCPKDLVWRT